MNQDTKTPDTVAGPPRPPTAPRHRSRALLAVALLGAGAIGAGATALVHRDRHMTLVALTPAPINTMRDGDAVAVKGHVAEIFGNKFILADDTGRTLIETGRRGEDGTLVSSSETVTVQGRFEHGFVHAAAIQHGDGRTVMLDPPRPPAPPHPPFG